MQRVAVSLQGPACSTVRGHSLLSGFSSSSMAPALFWALGPTHGKRAHRPLPRAVPSRRRTDSSRTNEPLTGAGGEPGPGQAGSAGACGLSEKGLTRQRHHPKWPRHVSTIPGKRDSTLASAWFKNRTNETEIDDGCGRWRCGLRLPGRGTPLLRADKHLHYWPRDRMDGAEPLGSPRVHVSLGSQDWSLRS